MVVSRAPLLSTRSATVNGWWYAIMDSVRRTGHAAPLAQATWPFSILWHDLHYERPSISFISRAEPRCLYSSINCCSSSFAFFPGRDWKVAQYPEVHQMQRVQPLISPFLRSWCLLLRMKSSRKSSSCQARSPFLLQEKAEQDMPLSFQPCQVNLQVLRTGYISVFRKDLSKYSSSSSPCFNIFFVSYGKYFLYGRTMHFFLAP